MNIKLLQTKCLKLLIASFFYLSSIAFIQVSAQSTSTVSGTIIEAATNTPMIGVNVIEKGTTNGTISDFDGKFNLKISNPEAIIEVRYLGYATQEILVAGQNNLNINMIQDAEALEEVVVVGYGTVKKTDLTGAVNSLSSKQITERNVTSPLEAIQGNHPKVPCLNGFKFL